MALKFKDKWDMLMLYAIASAYLQNQVEENALVFLERIREYTQKYCEEVK